MLAMRDKGRGKRRNAMIKKIVDNEGGIDKGRGKRRNVWKGEWIRINVWKKLLGQ